MARSFSWRGSRVLVTGASRGIGLAVASHARRRGARIGLVARSADDLDRAVGRLGDPQTGEIATAAADVSSRAQLESAIERIEATIGPTDVLVNNAGTGAFGSFGKLSLDELENALAVNYLGTVYATRVVLDHMVHRRSGHIVNMASVAGRVATPGETAYSASKFAIVGFTQCLAMDLRSTGVGVSMVLPGPVDTSAYFSPDDEYQRGFPPRVSADTVARATLAAVEHRRLEVVVPSWFRAVASFQATFSGFIAKLPAGVFDHQDEHAP